ncbi:MAG: hypothetical protein ACOYJ2_07530 [Rickettsiales bacterium]
MAENDSLLREVDEAIRQDRLMGLWNHLKMPIIYASIALILVTAGTSIWKHYQQAQAEKITLALANAQSLYAAKRYDQAAKDFEAITHQARGELADATNLWQARALLGAKKDKPALRVLQNIVLAPEGKDLFWRDIACLHLMGLVKTADEMPSQCRGKTASPLAPVLQQIYAASLWQAGDEKAARALLDALASNTELSPNVRAQARALDATIAHKE